MIRPKPTTHEVEHDCHLDGQPVRHTTVIEATPTRLTDGRTRWRGEAMRRDQQVGVVDERR